MVMNHYDSAFNRHPNPVRGCAESVNWNLKGAQIVLHKLSTDGSTNQTGECHGTHSKILFDLHDILPVPPALVAPH